MDERQIKHGKARRAPNMLALLAAAALGAATLALPARAEYPDRLIRMYIPYQGGAAENTARLMASKLNELYKQPVIVENKFGANGLIALEALTKSPADGYTLEYEASTLTFLPSLVRKVPVDVVRDLQPVAQIMHYPYVIVTNPGVPASTLPELVKFLKGNGNKTNMAYGSASLRVLGELFRQLVGAEATFVPYKGGGPATMAVMSGEVQMSVQDLPTIAPLVAAGKMRAIVVAADTRSRVLPNVPTAREAGLNDFVVFSWHGIFAPVGTPAEIVNKLNADINRIIMTPDMQQRIATLAPSRHP